MVTMTYQSERKGIALSNSTLSHFDGSIARPSYGRCHVVPGLVHIGAGAFNRSHLAVYPDDLLANGSAALIHSSMRCGLQSF
ncbi:MAG: hypothetical protein ABSE55_07780 [Terracidiphilus sp.]